MAELINFIDSLKAKDPRLASLAMTDFESAAMWAVKLVTTPEKAESSSTGSVGA